MRDDLKEARAQQGILRAELDEARVELALLRKEREEQLEMERLSVEIWDPRRAPGPTPRGTQSPCCSCRMRSACQTRPPISS